MTRPERLAEIRKKSIASEAARSASEREPDNHKLAEHALNCDWRVLNTAREDIPFLVREIATADIEIARLRGIEEAARKLVDEPGSLFYTYVADLRAALELTP